MVLAFLAAPLPSYAQYESLVSQVDPAVVFIEVTKPGIGTSLGSGFFIDTNGYILTARHVIEGADSVAVRTAAGRQLTAAIVNYSATMDAAVLKVDGTNFPVLHIGNSESVRQGQEVLVFGYPRGYVLGAESVTVTRGIVSALRSQEGLIQLDAAANPGNSGGPVITASGDVVGVLVGGVSNSQGLNFAVAMNSVRDLTAQLSPESKQAPPAPTSAYPFNGQWTAFFTSRNDSFTGQLILSQDRDTVAGTMQTQIHKYTLEGHFDLNSQQLQLSLSGYGRSATLTGALARPGILQGTFELHYGRLHVDGNWVAYRVPQ
jgi:hypothetical protein